MNGGKIDKSDIIPPMFGRKEDRAWWKCKKCGIYFQPEMPNVACPGCKSNSTVPARDYDPEKYGLWEPTKYEKIFCSECDELMARGYLVETNSPTQLITLGEGVYWTPDEFGNIFSRIPLKGFVCPKCGRLKVRVRAFPSYQPKIMEIRDKQYEN